MKNSSRLTLSLTAAALAAALPMLTPAEAQACGGTFCDTGPTAMPVDQTGENIAFHIGEDSVEVHIQIQYDPETEAAQFAWVIPVMALPEFEVGSQLFFDALLAGSVPSYGNLISQDFCGDGGDEIGGGLTTAADEGDGSGEGSDPEDEGGNPEVVYQGTIGAFEIAVLDGGTVEGVMTWLGDNGYEQDPNAEPILAEYLAEEYLFVAMKLSNTAGVDEIHPIILRYAGQEACVPLRLTRIAAVEDMDIRVFALGDERTVPVNYRHVLVNPLKIDWFNNASNYKEAISLAVDADGADGNAFVTEYAGSSNVVATGTFFSDLWDETPFLDLADSPVGAIELLEQQGLIFCDIDWDTTCTTNHPLLQPLLDEFMPVPEGVDPVLYYDCMECYADQIDLEAWDAALFAERFDERIIKPAEKARDLVQDNAYLTRMYTTISPNEMYDDPFFRENSTLPDVQNLRFSTQTLHCDGGTTVTLPDLREVYFPPGEPLVWPEFQDEMPVVEDVDLEGMAQNAPLINVVDNTEAIDELLEEWNQRKQDEADAAAEDAGLSAGCGCSANERGGGVGFGLALLALAGLIRRRRS
ncbi:DUF2330 domain-containing protein [Pseudenhygromyxa sp. WMMC2535]|nr:DUF2330 domain-containing protein [Pseudenhygromyxa sp. WMMC2535]NVB39458.1 DUF2330 domain-containing protein [Pseudenhygromyxa sp. WMMC2535]